MGAICDWETSREMCIFLGIYTDLGEWFSACFLQVGEVCDVKALVKAGQQSHRGD